MQLPSPLYSDETSINLRRPHPLLRLTMQLCIVELLQCSQESIQDARVNHQDGGSCLPTLQYGPKLPTYHSRFVSTSVASFPESRLSADTVVLGRPVAGGLSSGRALLESQSSLPSDLRLCQDSKCKQPLSRSLCDCYTYVGPTRLSTFHRSSYC